MSSYNSVSYRSCHSRWLSDIVPYRSCLMLTVCWTPPWPRCPCGAVSPPTTPPLTEVVACRWLSDIVPYRSCLMLTACWTPLWLPCPCGAASPPSIPPLTEVVACRWMSDIVPYRSCLMLTACWMPPWPPCPCGAASPPTTPWWAGRASSSTSASGWIWWQARNISRSWCVSCSWSER